MASKFSVFEDKFLKSALGQQQPVVSLSPERQLTAKEQSFLASMKRIVGRR